jgi:hypothetical protein
MTAGRNCLPDEKCMETADRLRTEVLNPVGDTIDMLRSSWTGDEASQLFRVRMEMHFQNLAEAQRLIREAAAGMSSLNDIVRTGRG